MKYKNCLVVFFLLCGIQISWSSSEQGVHMEQTSPKPLVVVNGYIVRFGELAKIKEDMIESRVDLSAEEGMELFGDAAKDGVVVITLKKKLATGLGNKVDDVVLQQLEELKEQKETFSKEIQVENKILLEGATRVEPIVQKVNHTSTEFVNQLQIEFEKSIRNPKISTVKVNGKKVTKEAALMLNVFDVDSAISTYKENSNDGVLEIYLTDK